MRGLYYYYYYYCGSGYVGSAYRWMMTLGVFQFRSRFHWATLLLLLLLLPLLRTISTPNGPPRKLTLQIIDPHRNLWQIIFANAI